MRRPAEFLAQSAGRMLGSAMSERDHLDRIAADSWYAKGLNAVSSGYSARVFARSWRGTRCLELGPAEGLMTAELARAFPDLTLVEGVEKFCRELRARFPAATVVCSIFEEFVPAGGFDTIVLGHVLEHVADPHGILARVRGWLAPGGIVC